MADDKHRYKYNRADPEFLAARAQRQRGAYAANRIAELARASEYKRNNPDRFAEYGNTRYERLVSQADGSATPEAIARLKDSLSDCQYCGKQISGGEKQTDHIVALALGGKHSLDNIAIVCASCNGRKATLTYSDWVHRVDVVHRDRVIALWMDRYGSPVEEAA